MYNKPLEISPSEWKEIMKVHEVQEGWGLEPGEFVEDFAPNVYGVKFHFESGSPGYVGELYILHGNYLGTSPLILIRKEGNLKVVS